MDLQNPPTMDDLSTKWLTITRQYTPHDSTTKTTKSCYDSQKGIGELKLYRGRLEIREWDF